MARVNAARAIELMQQEMDEPKHNLSHEPQVAGFALMRHQGPPPLDDGPTRTDLSRMNSR